MAPPATTAAGAIAPPDDSAPASAALASEASVTGSSPAQGNSQTTDNGKPQGEHERLVWAMERCGWVQAKAARLLKISPRQMGYALQKNGIEVRKF